MIITLDKILVTSTPHILYQAFEELVGSSFFTMDCFYHVNQSINWQMLAKHIFASRLQMLIDGHTVLQLGWNVGQIA